MAPIEHLAGAMGLPVLWAAVHLMLGLKEAGFWQWLGAKGKAVSDWFESQPRPAQLLLVVALTLGVFALVDGVRGWDVFRQLLYPEHKTTADVRFWSAQVYALSLLLGLPVAFLLWHWRDKNVTDQIDNARKDTNLTEFQEVQLRAAGALDEKLPPEAREQLQIAALHQLRGFLRGEYGDSFKRPAFEMLLAGHAAAIHRIGVPEVQKQIAGKTRKHIQEAVEALRSKLTAIDSERMHIIRDESDHIFRADYRLDRRRFDLLDLEAKDILYDRFLAQSHFFGARLRKTSFKGANLWRAHLEGADLVWAHLEGARLAYAHLEGADLQQSYFESANLSEAHFEQTFMWRTNFAHAHMFGAHLEGAELSEAHFEGAGMSRALFDDATCLARNWSKLTPEQRAVHQQKLRDLGARHVDDPKPDKSA